MKYLLSCILLILATIVLAQQPGRPMPGANQTPPPFPQGQQTPGQRTPPDIQGPLSGGMSSEQVEVQILQQFRVEPSLSGTNIDARANNDSVVLTGTVDTVAQHNDAVRIAQSNSGGRQVIDKIKVKQ